MLQVAFLDFYRGLGILKSFRFHTFFYLWGSKCLRLWPCVLSSFVFLFVATRHFLFLSFSFS
jgi:hypothetical protein